MAYLILIDFGDVQSPTEASSFSWNPSNANAAPGGVPVAAQVTDFSYTRSNDGYSPILAQYYAAGKTFNPLIVQFLRQQGDEAVPLMTYTFSNASIELFYTNDETDYVGVSFDQAVIEQNVSGDDS